MLRFGTGENSFNTWVTRTVNAKPRSFLKKVPGTAFSSGHLDHYGAIRGNPVFLENKFVNVDNKTRDSTVLLGTGAAKGWTEGQMDTIMLLIHALAPQEGPVVGGLVAIHHQKQNTVVYFPGLFILSRPAVTAGTLRSLLYHHADFLRCDDDGEMVPRIFTSLDELLEF